MKIEKINEELFDGQEELWIKFEDNLTVEGNKIKLYFRDFSDNDFHQLKNSLTQFEMEDIVNQLNLRETSLGDKIYYKDERGLSVVYCQKELQNNKNCLVILSIGESQPTRYRIFVLGIVIMD